MKTLLASLILMAFAVPPAQAQDWAIDGFDAVDFLQKGRPVPGRGDIATMWKGQIWHFATEENRNRFEADPRSFAPAFGGLCPVALSRGKHRAGDPRHFVVMKNRLYLIGTSKAKEEFRSNPQDILAKAEANWGH